MGLGSSESEVLTDFVRDYALLSNDVYVVLTHGGAILRFDPA